MSSVAAIPAAWASAASVPPPRISPTVSAWDRNECTVARTRPGVRRFTQTTLTARVTLYPVPSSTSWAADRWAWVTKYRLEVST